MALIIVNLPDTIVQSYLDNLGECIGRDILLSDLTEGQLDEVLSRLGDEMAGEMTMRTDDHSAFETEHYFQDILDK